MINFAKGFLNAEVAKENNIDMIMHGCNSHGVFGAGFALMVAKEFPEVYTEHMRVAKSDGLELGKVQFGKSVSDVHFANAITQLDTGTHQRQVNYEAVYTCLEQVKAYCVDNGINKLAMPQIGCGLAGGDWGIIFPMIKKFFNISDTDVVVYVP